MVNARIRSMGEGYVSTSICMSTSAGGVSGGGGGGGMMCPVGGVSRGGLIFHRRAISHFSCYYVIIVKFIQIFS